ncbi:hypothetical protein CP356_01920 [Lactobacillus sp. UMNPBX5]|nr:hypothetical protein CP356_01920 [Lactobacillus sp. UMNPBX5]
MLMLNLKQIMDEQHKSIQDVFEGTGISRNTISQLYNGKSKGIQFSTLTKLVNYLEIYPEEMFTEVTDYKDLEFDIDFNDSKNVQDILSPSFKITPDKLEDKIDEGDLFATILFIPSKYENEKYAVIEFKMPLYITFNSTGDVLWLSCNRDFATDDLEDDGDDYASYESKYNNFVRENGPKEVEDTFLSIVGYIVRKLSFKKEPAYFGFHTDFGNLDNVYLWQADTVLDEKKSLSYINLKYG